MDRLIESRQQWLLGIASERWTATEEEEKNQLFFFILFYLFSSLLLDRSIDRLSIIVGVFRCVDGCVVFVFGSIRLCLRMYTVLGVLMPFWEDLVRIVVYGAFSVDISCLSILRTCI